MTMPNYSDPRQRIQKTLAIIKPEAMCYRDIIIKRIFEAGFKILETKIVKLTPEQASELYQDKCHLPNFPVLVLSMNSGPIQAMCLAKPQAIREFKALVGEDSAFASKQKWPGSLRGCFGSYENDILNGIHASEDVEHARYEIRFFFPNSNYI